MDGPLASSRADARASRPRPPSQSGGLAARAPALHRCARPRRCPLADLEPLIDWTAFFQTWELRGHYPQILDEPRAKELYDDARKLLHEIIEKRLLKARAVYGIWPAQRDGDDVIVPGATFHTLRQQQETNTGHNLALADFVAPSTDYLGGFAVTAGIGVEELVAEFQKDHDDYNSIMTKRKASLSPAKTSSPRNTAASAPPPATPPAPTTRKSARSSRSSAPRTSASTSPKSCAMTPAASVSGFYFAHPESRYFAVGKIGRDRVEDYARLMIRREHSLPRSFERLHCLGKPLQTRPTSPSRP
jgi:5-methyltetrahydrofolate--homocysteine methyltransferase